MTAISFSREWAMPSPWTFTIPPIDRLLKEELIGEKWADPFAGMNSPAQIRNDINPEMNAEYHMDALVFLKTLPPNECDGILFDPPYSVRQVAECYNHHGYEVTGETTRMNFYSNLKNEIQRIVKPGGKVISFGWTTNGMGKARGFKITRIMIVAHGGHKNDTLVTVEVKHQSNLLIYDTELEH